MTPPPRRLTVLSILGVLAPFLLVLGIYLGGHPSDLPGFARSALVGDDDIRVVNQALDRISSDYYRPLRRSRLADDAIAGVVARLNDRFSTYLTPSEYREYVTQSDAHFSGVGMQVRQDPRGLLIVDVYPSSPAARAGLAAGDRIVSVGGRSIAGLADTRSRALIKGREGTAVTLGVLRGGHTRSVSVTRADITIPVVASSVRVVHGHRLGEVALETFSAGAHGEVRQAVDRLLRQGARGLVLDLRHNGGGLVEEARLVASIFLADGVIVTTRGRTQPTEVLTAAGNAIPASVPMVVLVDGQTASAAEIVTGALQDHHRAVVVGTHTYGKGVFQEVEPLSNGGALDLTVGQYFTPNGHNLGAGGIRLGAGITPDVTAADRPGTRTDEALDAALGTLAGRVR